MSSEASLLKSVSNQGPRIASGHNFLFISPPGTHSLPLSLSLSKEVGQLPIEAVVF